MHRLGMGLLLAISLSAPLSVSLPAFADTLLELSRSPVDKVIAYQGQGIISRRAQFAVSSAGSYRLRISDIPLNIVADSLRVSSDDKAQTVVQNVQLMPLPAGQESKEIQQLKTQIAGLELTLARNDNQQALNQRTQEWLDNYWEQASEKVTGQPQDWEKTLAFLNQSQTRILESQTQVGLQRQKVQQELGQLRKQLAELQAAGVNKTQAAVVYFTAKQAGNYTFNLSYLAQGMQWRPSYDARLDEKAGKVTLTYYGDVVQQTGENWQDVELSLSTAVPLLNAAVPQLEPWVITDRLPPVEQAKMRNAPAGNMARDELAAGSGEWDAAPSDSIFEQSDVQTQGLSVLFAIPQKVSIETSPHARRVAIASRSFAFEPEYQVVPKLSRQVFLRARFRNASELPLLAGQIRNYVDMDYTGTSQLSLVRPSEEASLNFGVDENIRVTRKEGTDKTSVTGIMRDTRRREMSYEIEVSNFKNKPVQVVVWDHLPLPQNEAVKLQVSKMEPQPQEQTKNNILRWNFQLKPQEKQKITVAYAIEHPLSMELYSNFTNEVEAPMRKDMQRQYKSFN